MGNSLQCRHILGARVHIFVLGRSLDSETVEDWCEEIFAEAVWVKWKNGPGGRGRGKKKYACLEGLFVCESVHQMDGGSD